MKTNLICMCILLTASLATAQDVAAIKAIQMDKFNELEGTWEGSGWISNRDGSRTLFNQSEKIDKKLNGTLLHIEGVGTDPETGNVTFQAFAIFTYDTTNEKYSIRSYLATGESTDAFGHFEDNRFLWYFDTPGGTVRYTMTITDTSWNEYGEFSRDGNQWFQFMEMYLNKNVSNNQ